jgi:hypothetical protein
MATMLVGRLLYSVVMCCITFYSPSTGGEWFIIYYYSTSRCATLIFIQQALCDPVFYSPSSVAGTTSPSTCALLVQLRAYHILKVTPCVQLYRSATPLLGSQPKGAAAMKPKLLVAPPKDDLLHITSIE